MDNTPTKSKRIEYIDAMRGFTMLLVVVHHVATFNMGYTEFKTFSYHSIFQEFRMPLFFFVSGFVLYKVGFDWNWENTWKFIKKKFPIQIIGPLFFMFVFLTAQNRSFVDALFGSHKGGYWFTLTLFEFFCFYIVTQWIIKLFKNNIIVENTLLLLSGLALYSATVYTMLNKWPLPENIRDLIGVPVRGYYIYFIIGTRIRKYFPTFEHVLDKTPIVLLGLLTFLFLNLYSQFFIKISNSLYFLLCALTGILVVLAFFRKNASSFSKDTKLGIVAQYVGRRTLDIYLIHFFFVESNMSSVLPNFAKAQSPFLEFCVSLLIAILIIAACLGVSKIVRLNPFIAHNFFGEKRETK